MVCMKMDEKIMIISSFIHVENINNFNDVNQKHWKIMSNVLETHFLKII
jgi:hypothetical protein